MTRRDNNPDRLDDGARAEAEMKERADSPVAPRYSINYGPDGEIEELLGRWEKQAKEDDAFDELIAGHHALSALPAPQGDDGLVGRLEHLVSLNEPEKGGPYQGFAAAQCIEAMREAASALRSQAAEIAGLKAERDHWRDYSSGQGKLIESGVFVKTEEYVRLAAAEARLATLEAGYIEEKVSIHRARAEAAEAKLASAMEALEPFAESPYAYITGTDDSDLICAGIMIGDLRRARTTLSSIKGAAE